MGIEARAAASRAAAGGAAERSGGRGSPAGGPPSSGFGLPPGHGSFGASSTGGVQWAVIGLFVLFAVFMLSWAAYFLLPATLAVMFGLTLGPAIGWLERRGVPSYLASAWMLISISALLYGLFLAFAIPLEEWSRRLPEVLEAVRQLIFSMRGPLERLSEIGQQVEEAARTGEEGLRVEVGQTGLVTGLLTATPAVMAQFLVMLGGFFFFMANRSRLRSALLGLPATPGGRWRVARAIRDTEYYLSRYVATIALVNCGLGVATALAMWALGMPSPALWGAMAAVLNFVPYLGPALMTAVLAGVALVTFDVPGHMMLPPIVFVLLNVAESQFATPAVLGQRLTLNPFIVFMSLAFWVWLWGPVGAFLAVPLLIVGVVVLFHCLSSRKVGGPASFGRPAARSGLRTNRTRMATAG